MLTKFYPSKIKIYVIIFEKEDLISFSHVKKSQNEFLHRVYSLLVEI